MSTNNIKTNIFLNQTKVLISHENCSEIGQFYNCLFLKEESEDLNTLIKIEIFYENLKQLIYFYWSNKYTIDSFNFFLKKERKKESRILFLATNNVIFAISLDTKSVLFISYTIGLNISLFWEFEKHQNYILALS